MALERIEKHLLRALSPLVRRINFRMGRHFLQSPADPVPPESAQWSGELLDAPFAMALSPRKDIPPEFLARIVAAYQSQAKKRSYGGDSMWSAFFRKMHGPLHAQLMSSDTKSVELALSNPAESTLHYGFDDIFKDSILALEANEEKSISYGTACRAALVRLAESIGVVRRFHPATGNRVRVPALNAEDVLVALDDFLGCRLKIPNIFPKEPGIRTSRGVITYRALTSIYAVCRTKSILGSLRDSRILEIGAGLGRTAYFAYLCGARAYDVVDLPMTAVAQGHFLGQTLGPGKVVLQGEPKPPSAQAPTVKLLSPEEFLGSNEHYDIVVNFDSMTEVGEDIANEYWQAIETRTDRFLSVNHEANNYTVHSLLQPTESAWMVLRNPSWLYPGYVEELAVRRDRECRYPSRA